MYLYSSAKVIFRLMFYQFPSCLCCMNPPGNFIGKPQLKEGRKTRKSRKFPNIPRFRGYLYEWAI